MLSQFAHTLFRYAAFESSLATVCAGSTKRLTANETCVKDEAFRVCENASCVLWRLYRLRYDSNYRET